MRVRVGPTDGPATESVLHSDRQIRSTRVLEGWVNIADAWRSDSQKQRIARLQGRGEQVGEATRRDTAGVEEAKQRGALLIPQGGQKDSGRNRVIESPCCVNHCGTVLRAEVVRKTDTRPPLLVIAGNFLWMGHQVTAWSRAHIGLAPWRAALGLRVTRAVPAESVSQGKSGGDLPLVLPVQADSRLPIGLLNVCLKDILPIQTKALDETERVVCLEILQG